jgi:hypothetical protein
MSWRRFGRCSGARSRRCRRRSCRTQPYALPSRSEVMGGPVFPVLLGNLERNRAAWQAGLAGRAPTPPPGPTHLEVVHHDQ